MNCVSKMGRVVLAERIENYEHRWMGFCVDRCLNFVTRSVVAQFLCVLNFTVKLTQN
jgi:hypothetical protein